MPEFGKITATVDVFHAEPSQRDDARAPRKVRLTIWSGLDFKTPTISRGAIFKDPGEAFAVAVSAVAACQLLGIPVEEGEHSARSSDSAAEPLLPEKRPEADYDRR